MDSKVIKSFCAECPLVVPAKVCTYVIFPVLVVL
jgi:hypothetical protein